jgi:hypothetical protein
VDRRLVRHEPYLLALRRLYRGGDAARRRARLEMMRRIRRPLDLDGITNPCKLVGVS